MDKIFRLYLLIIPFLFIKYFTVFAADYHWEFAGWSGGGCYPNIEFDPSVKGRVYLVSDVAGIWRSDDSGENWKFITKGLDNLNVALVSIFESNSNILYAGTKTGVYISRNAGESWEACSNLNWEISLVRPLSYRSIAIFPKEANKLCIGTEKGDFFYSDDYGKSWKVLGNRQKPFKDKIPITAVALSGDKTVFVSSERGLIRYSFENNTWEIIADISSKVFDICISKTNPNRIYLAGDSFLFASRDNGKSFEKIKPTLKGSITRVSLSESIGSPIVAVIWEKDWDGGVLKSKDDGKTWIECDKNMTPDITLNPTRAWARVGGRTASVKFNPFEHNQIFRTDWWGVWRSDDGGQTWKEKIKGAPNTCGSDIYVDSSSNIYIATMDNGLLMSNDDGHTYRALIPTKGYRKDLNGHVWRILVLNDHTIIGTSSPWGEKINQVLLSKNNGKDFHLVRDGLPLHRPLVNTMWGEGYPRAIAFDPTNTSLIYLGIDGDDGGGLFISKNGGSNWIYSTGQPGSKRIYNALAVDPTDSNRIFWGACGKGGGVYLSQDKGISWNYVFSEMTWVFDLAISKNGVVYALGDNSGPSIYMSNNHGRTWSLLQKFLGRGTAEAIYIDPNNSQRIVVSTVQWSANSGGKVFLSEDAGKTWRDITGDLPDGTGAAAMAFDPKSSYLYIIRYAGSVYKTKI
jgi:photosystem II stability/assembly factor-like uncharacterized protein